VKLTGGVNKFKGFSRIGRSANLESGNLKPKKYPNPPSANRNIAPSCTRQDWVPQKVRDGFGPLSTLGQGVFFFNPKKTDKKRKVDFDRITSNSCVSD
jgi:hypothetical protein